MLVIGFQIYSFRKLKITYSITSTINKTTHRAMIKLVKQYNILKLDFLVLLYN